MLPEPWGNSTSIPTVKYSPATVCFSSFLHMGIIYLIMNWKPNSLWTLKCPSEASHWDRECKCHSSCTFPVYNATGTHTDLSRAFRQWLLSQGLFIAFIKSRHKPQGWLLAEAVESCSSTFHTHALLTALNRFLINPSNCMNQDCTHCKNTQPWNFRHSPENGRASLNQLAERRDWARMTGPGWVQGSILTLGGGIKRTGTAAAAAASLLYFKQRQQPTTAFLQMQSGRAASAAGGQTWHWAAQFCWGWQGSGHTQRHSFRCLGNYPGSSQQLCEHRGIEIWAQTV